MPRCRHLGFLLALTLASPGVASAADPIDTSGHTRLKVFGALYGTYVGITFPVFTGSNSVAPYAIGLMGGPSIGLVGAAEFTSTHGFSEAQAITLSSMVWFGAMQGHLWAGSMADVSAESNAGAGLLGSLAGVATAGLVSPLELGAGHAAALGAGNWWGMALGFHIANSRSLASAEDKSRGAAIGAALGLGIGAATGAGTTHSEIRYLHLGAALGWLYSAGLVSLVEPTNKSTFQIAGIGTGMAAGLLAAKHPLWRARDGQQPDHSGRLRAQTFSLLYGGYLATVVPLAAGIEWEEEKTFTLSYMHAPLALVLGTTFATRNLDVTKANTLTLSGLTWFGATQGALWASTVSNPQTRDIALTSAVGSGVGLVAGALATRHHPTEGQAALLGAGNWWGSALGLLGAGAVGGENVTDTAYAASVALGSIAGVAIAPFLGQHMTSRSVATMNAGGLVGWFFGAGILLGGDGISASAANTTMAATTLAGLAIGGQLEDGSSAQSSGHGLGAQPFVTRRRDLGGEMQTAVGVSLRF